MNRMEGQLGDFKQQSLCSSLRSAVVRRQYLLQLKAKYAGIVECSAE